MSETRHMTEPVVNMVSFEYRPHPRRLTRMHFAREEHASFTEPIDGTVMQGEAMLRLDLKA